MEIVVFFFLAHSASLDLFLSLLWSTIDRQSLVDSLAVTVSDEDRTSLGQSDLLSEYVNSIIIIRRIAATMIANNNQLRDGRFAEPSLSPDDSMLLQADNACSCSSSPEQMRPETYRHDHVDSRRRTPSFEETYIAYAFIYRGRDAWTLKTHHTQAHTG